MNSISSTPMLEGERISLYPLNLSFCSERYLSWLNDSDVYAHLNVGGNYTIQELYNFVNKNTVVGVLFWAIVVKADNNHIGNIKIDKINLTELHGEYGIMIGEKSAWGRGYGAEASKIVIDYCFNNIGLEALNLGVHTENLSAVNLYKKLGFSIVATESSKGDKKSENNLNYRMTLLKNN
jgi:[ribosomal protein S5]-alanine N-acetyltransferase